MEIARKKSRDNNHVSKITTKISPLHNEENKVLNKNLVRRKVPSIERNNDMERTKNKRKSSEKNEEYASGKKLFKGENGDAKVDTANSSCHTKIAASKSKISKQSMKDKELSKVLSSARKKAKEMKPSAKGELKSSAEGQSSIMKSNNPKRKFQNSEKLEGELLSHTSCDGTSKLKVNVKKRIKDTSQEKEEKKPGKNLPRKKTTKKESGNKYSTKTPNNKSRPKSGVHQRQAETKSFGDVPDTDPNDPMTMLMMMEGGHAKNLPASLSRFETGHSSLSALNLPNSDRCIEQMVDSDDSDDELSDWEDVKDHTLPVQDDHSQIQPVQITLEMPDFLNKKRKKKGFDWKDHLEKMVRRFKKDVAINLHKSHILCLIAHGLRQNSILNDETVSGLILSVVPTHLNKKASSSTERLVDGAMSWYRKKFPLDQISHTSRNVLTPVDVILKALSKEAISDARLWVFIFIVVLRTLGLSVRLVLSLQPIPYKATEIASSSKASGSTKGKGNAKNKKSSVSKDSKPVSKHKSSKPPSSSSSSSTSKTSSSSSAAATQKQSQPSSQRTISSRRSSLEARVKSQKNLKDESEDDDNDDDSSEEESKVNKGTKGRKRTNVVKNEIKPEDENSESDFEVTSPYFCQAKELKVKSNRKILSQSEDDEDGSSRSHDFWLEVYLEDKKKWICFDCFKNMFGKPYVLGKRATQPVSYVIAFRNDNSVKDVTSRYAKQWFSQTRKIRVDIDWLEETFASFDKATYSERIAEEDEIKSQLMVRPMPSNISEFKSHPLYALRRHLLKFEAIYPDTAIPVGYIRKEPVYARECVRTLHSRHNWLKEGRLVRLNEEPYKMVKSRPKWNMPKENPNELDLEVFGEWQTEIYIPPPAFNGKVPKNEYGNVELFKPWMLPTGTVQLKVQGLQRVAKKLNIDIAPAMVGWDHHSGHAHPVFDGFIVCEEFADSLLDAWDEDQEIQKQKDEEKREKRVYGNWRLLIRSLLIKERLKIKFLQDAPLMECEEKKEAVITSKPGDQTAEISGMSTSTKPDKKHSDVNKARKTLPIMECGSDQNSIQSDTKSSQKKEESLPPRNNVKAGQEKNEENSDLDDFEISASLTAFTNEKPKGRKGVRQSDVKGKEIEKDVKNENKIRRTSSRNVKKCV